MPFWWRRRRKPWYGRFRYRRRYYKTNTRRRKRRTRIRTRRNRRFANRRYKRRRKVRRKLKKITLKQWQPDSVKKCKIKGYSCLVLGGEGTQMFCYTNEASNYPQPKAPGGGGFGVEVISLKWLYQQFLQHNNIWTKSNNYTDLVRYTGCQIIFYRHPTIDFIAGYDIQPPFDLNKYSYAEMQPQNLLLRRHRKLILSRATNPKGRLTVKMKIRPPKQLITKWFFQKDFCTYGLVKIFASACDFNYPRIGPISPSTILTVYSLSTTFYNNSDWAKSQEQGYKNITTQVTPITFYYKNKQGVDSTFVYNPDSVITQDLKRYYYTINRDTGLFNAKVLLSYKYTVNSQTYATTPLIVLRYNPHEDTGHGNEVYLTNILGGHYNKPSISTDYSFNNVPLPIAFYGYWNYLQQYSKDKNIFKSYMFVVKCPALKPITQTTAQVYYPILDADFVYGNKPWDEFISETDKKLWYPTAEKQQQIINAIVESGPYMPRLSNLKYSTWELDYRYKFFFKWGGPQVSDPAVEDPCQRGKYPVPDTVQKKLQITNPEKCKTEELFHDWDLRRGFITSTALKRMSENLQTDSSLQSDDSESPKKKRKITKELQCQTQKQEKIQECLLSLFEENTCQESPEDLQQFIQQQQQQQHLLKRNILQLLTHLKKAQRCTELQTGLLE
nr:MAG: ORF1 [Torque teno midi virus]